jgi:hypothetical protein
MGYHITGLFERKTWLDLLNKSGFDVYEQPWKYHPEPERFPCLSVGTVR